MAWSHSPRCPLFRGSTECLSSLSSMCEAACLFCTLYHVPEVPLYLCTGVNWMVFLEIFKCTHISTHKFRQALGFWRTKKTHKQSIVQGNVVHYVITTCIVGAQNQAPSAFSVSIATRTCIRMWTHWARSWKGWVWCTTRTASSSRWWTWTHSCIYMTILTYSLIECHPD